MVFIELTISIACLNHSHLRVLIGKQVHRLQIQDGRKLYPSHSSSLSVSPSHRRRMSKSMSPTREVAPKLVMGSKKYGRRSRPQFNEKLEASQSEGEAEEEAERPKDDESNSEEDEEGEEAVEQIEGQGTIKVHRSASQVDVKRRRQPKPNSSKLKRCASLPARRNMAREFVRIRGSSPNKHVKAQLDSSSVESLGNFFPVFPCTLLFSVSVAANTAFDCRLLSGPWSLFRFM